MVEESAGAAGVMLLGKAGRAIGGLSGFPKYLGLFSNHIQVFYVAQCSLYGCREELMKMKWDLDGCRLNSVLASGMLPLYLAEKPPIP
jgi:hypothetical protein